MIYNDNVIIRDLLASLTNEEINVIAAMFKKRWNFETKHGFTHTTSHYGKKVNAYSVERFAYFIHAQVNDLLSLKPDKFTQDEFDLKMFNEIRDVLYIFERLVYFEDGDGYLRFNLYGSYRMNYEMIPVTGDMSKIISCPLAKSSLNIYGKINCLFAFLYDMSQYGFTFDEIEKEKLLSKNDTGMVISSSDEEFCIYCYELKKKFIFKNYKEFEEFMGTKEGRIYMKQRIKEKETEDYFRKRSLWNVLRDEQ